MATQVNIHEAKTHFSKLVTRVMAGEEVLIAKAGKPVAKLVPIRPEKKAKRPFGLGKGKIWIADDFDVMSEAELAEFYDGHPGDPLLK
jgi:prevent-host-death family protein